MKRLQTYGIYLIAWMISGCMGLETQAQPSEATTQHADTVHISKLELQRNKREVFNSRDSVLILQIDTLIMKDRSSLQFYGKNSVKIQVKHAEIGDRVHFTGTAGQNNASDMDICIHFHQLGSLFIMADGLDANNGMRTHPNGDGGDVRLYYDRAGIAPQEQNTKESHYLHISTSGGGQHSNAAGDARRIMDRIRRTGTGVRGLPQGQIFSGTPGQDGTVKILPMDSGWNASPSGSGVLLKPCLISPISQILGK